MEKLYDVLVFDFDDTLFDYAQTEKTALIAVFNELNLPYEPSYQFIFKQINRFLWNESEKNEHFNVNNLRLERFKELFKRLKYINYEELSQKASEIYIEYSKKGKLIDGVEETIKKLYDFGFTLVIASSGLSVPRNDKLKNSSIGNMFSHVFFREQFENDKVKPHKEFFEKVSSTFSRIPKKKILYIGNDYYNDVKPAKMSGLSSLWFNYMNISEKDVDISFCDHIVYSFSNIINEVCKKEK